MSLVNSIISDFEGQVKITDCETGEVLACPGLSPLHNSPRLEWRDGGGLLKAVRGKAPKVHYERGKRGVVKGFSNSSRRRLLRLVSSVDLKRKPVFVTLTYPGEFPFNPRLWKRHLDTFIKRLGRKFGQVSGVWKLEAQERGAPHYHMLIWGVEYSDLISFVSSNWYEVVGSGDENHLRAGTRVEIVRSHRGVLSYASKYLGKVEQPMIELWDMVGRYWGVFFRDRLPVGVMRAVYVDYKTAVTIIRYMRRFARLRSRAYYSLTVNCNSDNWISRLL